MGPASKNALPPLLVEDLAHVLAHTRDLWEELRGQSLFITGGTGFFGIWLLESFAYANEQLGLGARAVVLTRDPSSFAAKAPHLTGRDDLVFIPGDVRNFDFPSGSFPFVIHAGTTSSAPVEPVEMFETIVDGSRRVLDFAAAHGTRKLLFVSSGAVYGPQPPDLTHTPEDYSGGPDPLNPNSAYGEGKRAGEFLCGVMSRKHGFDAKIARCFAFVGPHLPLDAHFAIGNFIRDALGAGPIRVKGDGTPFRSYLYAADLAVWLWTLLFRGKSDRAYNVGSDEAITIGRLAEIVGETLGNPRVHLEKGPFPGNPPSRYVPAIARAKREMSVEVRIPLTNAIRKTVRWLETATPLKLCQQADH